MVLIHSCMSPYEFVIPKIGPFSTQRGDELERQCLAIADHQPKLHVHGSCTVNRATQIELPGVTAKLDFLASQKGFLRGWKCMERCARAGCV